MNNGKISLLSIYNIYIIPLLNPDGYEYAQTQVFYHPFFFFLKIKLFHRDECGERIEHRMDIFIEQIPIVSVLISIEILVIIGWV